MSTTNILFGSVEKSTVNDGLRTIIFRIPAFSQRIAERRAIQNAIFKDVDEPQVEEVNEDGEGSLPGQTVFFITVTGVR